MQITNGLGRKYSPAWSPDDHKIVFSSTESGYYQQIYVINADGTNPIQLTKSVGNANEPSWSPNGKQIVFVAGGENGDEIFVMNADGTALKQLTNLGGRNAPPGNGFRESPNRSPDGRKIVFNSCPEGTAEIYVMNSDGSNIVRLTNNTQDDSDPEWSPDGSRIAFAFGGDGGKGNQQIFVMDADGSRRTDITKNGNDNQNPTWSPDGPLVVFILYSGFPSMPDIYTINADGGKVTRITRWKQAACCPPIYIVYLL